MIRDILIISLIFYTENYVVFNFIVGRFMSLQIEGEIKGSILFRYIRRSNLSVSVFRTYIIRLCRQIGVNWSGNRI